MCATRFPTPASAGLLVLLRGPPGPSELSRAIQVSPQIQPRWGGSSRCFSWKGPQRQCSKVTYLLI